MFKLAGEGVHNDFPSDKYCTLQKVLQARWVGGAVRRRPADKLEVFSEECFKDVFLQDTFSGIFHCYDPQVRRGAIYSKCISHVC